MPSADSSPLKDQCHDSTPTVEQISWECRRAGKGTSGDEEQQIDSYLTQQKCEWIFNPPHASHAGGIWEHMIGMAQKILDAMLHKLPTKQLTHKVFTTLNSSPLPPESTDPEGPMLMHEVLGNYCRCFLTLWTVGEF